MRAERILFVNALMSVMKLCNLKSKVDDKETHAYAHTHAHTAEAREFIRGDMLEPVPAHQLPERR